jgi:hypothetical protein
MQGGWAGLHPNGQVFDQIKNEETTDCSRTELILSI